MKYLVLGGGGFIGSTLSDQLIEQGHFVRIFEAKGVKPYRIFNSQAKVEWIEGDFSSSEDIDSALLGIDVVFHLISSTIPKNSNDNPIFDVKTNLLSALQLLELMIKNNVSKIVFASSGGTVYGTPNYLPIDEQHPTNPLVSYGVTKLAIEKYLLLYQKQYGIRSLILRMTNPYGVRQRYALSQGVISVFLNRFLNDEPIEIWGNTNITRDYVYITDITKAFILAANYNGSHSIFNISSGIGISLDTLIALIKDISNIAPIIKQTSCRSFDVDMNVLSNSLAFQQLGWSPTISLSDGIRLTLDWLKSTKNHYSTENK